jgi:hypothetical protein
MSKFVTNEPTRLCCGMTASACHCGGHYEEDVVLVPTTNWEQEELAKRRAAAARTRNAGLGLTGRREQQPEPTPTANSYVGDDENEVLLIPCEIWEVEEAARRRRERD